MAPEWVDHYKVLGIAPDASADEITAAHRRRIREVHPDVASGSGCAEAATQINVARDVLLNPRARRRFDDERRQRRRPARPAPRTAQPTTGSPRSGYSAASAEDASARTEQPPRDKRARADFGAQTWYTQAPAAAPKGFSWTSVFKWALAVLAVVTAVIIIAIGLGAKGLGTLIVWADKLRSSAPAAFELGQVRIGTALVGFGWYLMRIAIALFTGVGLLQAVLNWHDEGGSATTGPSAA